jgi:hypothetical protein
MSNTQKKKGWRAQEAEKEEERRWERKAAREAHEPNPYKPREQKTAIERQRDRYWREKGEARQRAEEADRQRIIQEEEEKDRKREREFENRESEERAKHEAEGQVFRDDEYAECVKEMRAQGDWDDDTVRSKCEALWSPSRKGQNYERVGSTVHGALGTVTGAIQCGARSVYDPIKNVCRSVADSVYRLYDDDSEDALQPWHLRVKNMFRGGGGRTRRKRRRSKRKTKRKTIRKRNKRRRKTRKRRKVKRKRRRKSRR